MTEPTPSVTDAQRTTISLLRQVVAARQQDEAAAEARYRQEYAAADKKRQAALQANKQQTAEAERIYTLALRDADARYQAVLKKSTDDQREADREADSSLAAVKKAYDAANGYLAPIGLAMPQAVAGAAPSPADALADLRKTREQAPKLATEIAEEAKWMAAWQTADALRSQRLGIAAAIILVVAIISAVLGYVEVHYRAGTAALAAGRWADAQSELGKASAVFAGYRDLAEQRYAGYYYPAQTAVAQRNWTAARESLEAAGTPVPRFEIASYSNPSQSNGGHSELRSEPAAHLLIEAKGMEALANGNVQAAALLLNQLTVSVLKPEVRDVINNNRQLRAALKQQNSPLLPPSGAWTSSSVVMGRTITAGDVLSLTLNDCGIGQVCGHLTLKTSHCSGDFVFAFPEREQQTLRAYHFDVELKGDRSDATCEKGFYDATFDGRVDGTKLTLSGPGGPITADLKRAN